ncbi:hypothetical protein NEOLEDRAFT_1046926, partial [Neolentinus lepideus HHB14362 ss-1]
SEGEPGVTLPDCLRGRYREDAFFRDVLSDPVSHSKLFEVESNLIYLRQVDDPRVLCIPDIMVKGKCLREILISHAHSILAHLGGQKTLRYLRENVWW